MPQTILGIDLGSYSVKIVQLERSLGDFKIVHFYELPLVASEVLNRYQACSAALIKFFHEHPIKYDYCVMAIPGQSVSIRYLTLPFTKKQKIEQVLQLELDDFIPFEGESLSTEYYIIDSLQGISRVMVTFLKTDQLQKYADSFFTSQIDPRYLGVDGIDLANLAILGCLPSLGTYAILDIGHSKSNLVLMQSGKLRAVRCLNTAGLHFTTAIRDALNFNFEDAEDYKHHKAQINKSTEPVAIALRKVVDQLFFEVKQTLFAFYEKGEAPIDALYLSGGSSNLSGLDQYFSNRLRVNVNLLDVIDDSYTRLADPEKIRAIIPTALGAAIRAIHPGKVIPINFRKGDFAYKKDIEELGGGFKKIAIAALVILGLGITHFSTAYYTLSSRVEKLNKNVEKMVKASIGDIEPTNSGKSSKTKKTNKNYSASQALSSLNGKVSSLRDKLGKLQDDSVVSSLEILKQVSSALPSRQELKLDVEELTVSAGRVRLKGATTSYDSVAKVQSALQQIKTFKNVTKGDERKGTAEDIKFTISFDVSAKEDEKVSTKQ